MSFVYVLFCEVFEGEDLGALLKTGQGKFSDFFPIFLHVVRSNFLHFRTLDYKSLIIIKVNADFQVERRKKLFDNQLALLTMFHS